MQEMILFVDDDINLLHSIRRQMHNKYQLMTAVGSEEGLHAIKNNPPFAVVVSDLKMPGMDGITFLNNVKKLSPDTVRIMLTGNADMQSAIDAVNYGSIFRFLIKPTETDTLESTLNAALQQYHLVTAEKVLLGKTLKGSIKLLIEMLQIADKELYEYTIRAVHLMKIIGVKCGISNTWELEMAAMLSQLGVMTLPPGLFLKLKNHEQMTVQEILIIEHAPEITCSLLQNIPRLESITNIIKYQNKHYDGSGVPDDGIKSVQIPLPSRIMNAVFDFQKLRIQGKSKEEAIIAMNNSIGTYDPKILKILCDHYFKQVNLKAPVKRKIVAVKVKDLKIGYRLESNLVSTKHMTILPAGHYFTKTSLFRVYNYQKITTINEPVYVAVPVDSVKSMQYNEKAKKVV